MDEYAKINNLTKVNHHDFFDAVNGCKATIAARYCLDFHDLKTNDLRGFISSEGDYYITTSKVQCCNCQWVGKTIELATFREYNAIVNGEWRTLKQKGCPNCKTDSYLHKVIE